MNNKYSIIKSNTRKLLKIFLFVSLILHCVVIPNTTIVNANTSGVHDPDTSRDYLEYFSSNGLNDLDGKVWVDKSVTTLQTPLDFVESDQKQDFLVTYSALSKSSNIENKTNLPMDVVFIIDLSASMFCAKYGGYMDPSKTSKQSRLSATVEALNDTIAAVLAHDPDNRISVVSFGKFSETIFELGRYTPNEQGKYISLSSEDVTTTELEVLHLSTVTNKVMPLQMSENNIGFSTNIQQGMYSGMEVLTSEEDTQGRTPVTIMLGDGAAYASNKAFDWRNPLNSTQSSDISRGGQYISINTLRAMLVATDMKAKVEQHYHKEMTLFTIGIGVNNGGNIHERYAAAMALNPKSVWDEDQAMVVSIRSLWEQMLAGKTVLEWKDPMQNSNQTAEVAPLEDIEDITSYVDAYFPVENYEECISAFDEIADRINLSSAASVPTQAEKDPSTSGYLIYRDIIGDYMHVKDVESIIYNGVTFTSKQTIKTDLSTTYLFEGSVDSGIYKDSDLSKLMIGVTLDPTTGRETIEIKVPASLIPMIVDDVLIDYDGSKSLTKQGTMLPLHVNYIVGLSDTILDHEGKVDHTKIDLDYLQQHTKTDGEIAFYTNYFSHELVNQTSIGNTVNFFTPSASNRAYDVRSYKVNEKQSNDTSTAHTVSTTFKQDNTVFIPLGNNGMLSETLADIAPQKEVYTEDNSTEIDSEQVVIGQVLTYQIHWTAPSGGVVRIEDCIPQHTSYVSNSASHNAEYQDGKLIWDLGNQLPGASGTVQFQVKVEPSALDQSVENRANVWIGENQSTTNTTQNTTTPPTLLTLRGDKIFTGRDMERDEVFEFILTPSNQVTIDAIANGTITIPNNKAEIRDTKDGQLSSFYFEDLSFGQIGSFAFELKEIHGTSKDIIYDTQSYEVLIDVTQTSEGQLQALVVNSEETFLFENNTVPPVSITLEGYKLFHGRDMFEDEAFIFGIRAKDELTQAAIDAGLIVLPENYSLVRNALDGVTSSFQFDGIQFSDVGIYQFEIYEVIGDNLDILYDECTFDVVVQVEKTDIGTLGATITYSEVILFENTYFTPEEPPKEPEFPPIGPVEPPVEPELPPTPPEEPPVEPELPPTTPEIPEVEPELPPGTGSASELIKWMSILMLMSGCLYILRKPQNKQR